jgi:hypothetical protein
MIKRVTLVRTTNNHTMIETQVCTTDNRIMIEALVCPTNSHAIIKVLVFCSINNRTMIVAIVPTLIIVP